MQGDVEQARRIRAMFGLFGHWLTWNDVDADLSDLNALWDEFTQYEHLATGHTPGRPKTPFIEKQPSTADDQNRSIVAR